MIPKLKAPIQIFSCPAHGICLGDLQVAMRRLDPLLEPDEYLIRQKRIELLRGYAPDAMTPEEQVGLWRSFYQGESTPEQLYAYLRPVPLDVRSKINDLLPTRRRCVSRYGIESRDQWRIRRLPPAPFEQQLALTVDGTLDFRRWPRTFRELPSEFFDAPLRGVIDLARRNTLQAEPSATALTITVHHTVVQVQPGATASNSPEGIHQDGMDYIVSALVVERHNIRGGTSIVYMPDQQTALLKCELQEGFGLFQPDAGSPLWHEVSPITVDVPGRPGFRSSIGLDIQVRH